VARRVCDLANLVNEEAIARVGLQRHVKKKILLLLLLGTLFGINNHIDKMEVFTV
jgi:hypothetical protein